MSKGTLEGRKKELEEKLANDTLTDAENEELENLRRYEGKLDKNTKTLNIKLDTSPEYDKLRNKANFFEKQASTLLQKATALGIKSDMPETEEDLILLHGLVTDKQKGQTAGGVTPLSGQYTYSGQKPLRQREYDSYKEMCIDVQKEAEKGNKEAEQILLTLLAKETRAISRKGVTEKEFHGKITDFQKIPDQKATEEQKEVLDEQLKKAKGKWRVPK